MAKIILNSKATSIDNIIQVTENKEKIHSRIKTAIINKTIFIEVVEAVGYCENPEMKKSSLININHISKIS